MYVAVQKVETPRYTLTNGGASGKMFAPSQQQPKKKSEDVASLKRIGLSGITSSGSCKI
jgi:hypothetical protein